MSSKNIFLIGMMGSGKSTIAPQLSKKINIKTIDIDNDLLSILEMDFLEINEKKFRHLESVYFIERIKNGSHIYATGGGIILKKENRNAMKNTGVTFFLDASTDELYKRLNKTDLNKRPLINQSNIKKSLDELWDKRKHLYYNSADYIINTNGKNIDNIINEIIEKLNENC